MSCRVIEAIVRAKEPHHLREALRLAGIFLDQNMVNQFIFSAKKLLDNSVDSRVSDCLEEFIEMIEGELKRREQVKLCFAAIVIAKSKKRADEIKEAEEAEFYATDDQQLVLQKRGNLIQDFEPQAGMSLMFALEREAYIVTLEKCDFNRTKAAKVLGVSIRTLRNKINFFLGRFALYDEYMESKRHLQ